MPTAPRHLRPASLRFACLPLAACALALSAALATPLAAALPASIPPASTPSASTLPAPDAPPQAGTAPHAMVVAANPLAVAAGLKVLKAGGNAVDAAVAVQSVLGLVEPQSSGVGGGAFMVYYDARTHQVSAYDGREKAPAGASPRQFLGADGQPLPFGQVVTGGIATGVPGAIAMLEMAQKDHGRRPWASLFADAQRLAREGFIVSPRLASRIASDVPTAHAPDVVAYFTRPDGQPYTVGDRLKNPAYAQTLARIARQGAAGLLSGPVAADIVARLHQGPYPSSMTLADLAAYRPLRRAAICVPYRAYRVCTGPVPSGGLPVAEALGLLAHTDIASRTPADDKAWFQFIEASRLAYADRDRYEGDPAYVQVPTAGLLAPAYLAARARLIGEHFGPVAPGQPAGARPRAPDATPEPGGTSHMVIVDKAGNVVSMTTTVEFYFGSGRMVDGFFLNNQLTDFSFSPQNPDGTAAANALAPGKRPRSSMAPTVVLGAGGRFAAATGSPGGSSIVAYTLKALVGLLDWHLSPQQAVALPNVVARGDVVWSDPLGDAVSAGLRARGVMLAANKGEISGLQAVVVTRHGLAGGSDPRSEGVARGF